MKTEKFNIDELKKSLSDFFTEDEVNEIMTKAEGSDGEEKEEDDDDDEISKMEAALKAKKDAKVKKSEKNELGSTVSADYLVKSVMVTIEKSFEDKFLRLEEKIEELGNTPMGKRGAVRSNQVTERFAKGGAGNELSLNKKNVERLLDSAIEKAVDPDIRKNLENAMLRINAGNSMPNQNILDIIQKSENVTFVS